MLFRPGAGATNYSWTGGITNGVSFIPTSTQTYTVTGTDGNGCSNSASQLITVNPMPVTTVNLSGQTLTATQAGAVYQWLDCNSGFSSISGATQQNFTPTSNGNYAVLVNLNGCSDTSVCTPVIITKMEADFTRENFIVYPNPVSDILFFNHVVSCAEITSLTGQKLTTIYSTDQINVRDFSAGIYWVSIWMNETRVTLKWVKE